MSKRKLSKKKWATNVKVSLDKGREKSIYPFTFCDACPRRYYGVMKDLDGKVIQEYNCWDTCVYFKDKEKSYESFLKNVV